MLEAGGDQVGGPGREWHRVEGGFFLRLGLVGFGLTRWKRERKEREPKGRVWIAGRDACVCVCVCVALALLSRAVLGSF